MRLNFLKTSKVLLLIIQCLNVQASGKTAEKIKQKLNVVFV